MARRLPGFRWREASAPTLLHRWRQPLRESSSPAATPAAGASKFDPISMADGPATTISSDIRIESRRGTMAMTVTW